MGMGVGVWCPGEWAPGRKNQWAGHRRAGRKGAQEAPVGRNPHTAQPGAAGEPGGQLPLLFAPRAPSPVFRVLSYSGCCLRRPGACAWRDQRKLGACAPQVHRAGRLKGVLAFSR